MVADTVEHIAQVGLGLEAIERCRADQSVEGRRTLATRVGAGEEPVLAAKATGRMAFSAALLEISSRPSSRWRVKASQRERA